MSAHSEGEHVVETARKMEENMEECIGEFSNCCGLLGSSSGRGSIDTGPANELTCAICLNQIAPTGTAQPDCCEHIYCTCCLLHWAVYKEKPWCPQCKLPFSSMLTFRTLDGTLHDYPCRESIALLRRANWFQEYLKRKEQLIAEALLPEAVRNRSHEGSVIDENDYLDYARYYEEYDDDEEVADYYFSSAAGRARISIGNRRHGPNGFMSSGRMRARPTPSQAQGKGKSATTQGHETSTPKGKQAGGAASKATPKATSSGKKKGGCVGEDYDDDFGAQSTGRRARRNQRKAAADAKAAAWG